MRSHSASVLAAPGVRLTARMGPRRRVVYGAARPEDAKPAFGKLADGRLAGSKHQAKSSVCVRGTRLDDVRADQLAVIVGCH